MNVAIKRIFLVLILANINREEKQMAYGEYKGQYKPTGHRSNCTGNCCYCQYLRGERKPPVIEEEELEFSWDEANVVL